VSDEDRLAGTRHRIVDARGAVGRGGHQLGARRVEGNVQDLLKETAIYTYKYMYICVCVCVCIYMYVYIYRTAWSMSR